MQGQYPNGISPEAVSAMLKLASQKLGMTPEQLQSTLSDPKRSSELLSQLDRKSCGGIKEAAESPQAFEDFLNSNPKAKKLFDELTKGKKG